jgi:hypothetical protein
MLYIKGPSSSQKEVNEKSVSSIYTKKPKSFGINYKTFYS